MRRGIALLLVVVGAFAAPAVSAGSGDTGKSGRVQFVKRADAICQPLRDDAQAKVAHGVALLERKHPSVRRAGRHFVAAWRLMRHAYHEVDDIHRPDGYRKKIANWLNLELHSTSLGVRSAIW